MRWKTLDARGVHAAYYREDVVSGMSLEVDSGDFVGIVGPNGSGKTSFLKAISRALRPREGAVLLEGEDLYGLPARKAARKMAMVPQENPISFGFTALEVVLMGRNPHLGRMQSAGSADLELSRQAMERSNVWHLADRPVNELSGGERQRVIIAQALAQDTGLLLLDEPTQHLDINHQLSLLETLAEMCSRDLAVVMVMHDLNLASQYCDRIIVMRRGREYARGTPEEVLTSDILGEVFGVGSIVTRHAVTRRPHIVFLPRGDGDAAWSELKVHLVCGGGSGASLMRDLLERGCYLTAGVLNLGDGDEEVGRALEIRMVTEAPFSHISADAHRANLDIIRESDAVLVSDLHIGPGNLINLEAALQALEWGKKVYLLSPHPIETRDHTAGRARELYERLLGGGALECAKREEVLSLLKAGRGEGR